MRRNFIFCFCICAVATVSIVVAGAAASPWEQVVKTEIPCNIAGFMNPSYGIAVGYEGETHYTLDGGRTWQIGRNEAFDLLGLEILDSQNAWACGTAARVRGTGNGGKDWHSLQSFGVPSLYNSIPHSVTIPVHPRYLSFVSKEHGWIASHRKLARTEDGGRSWIEMKVPVDREISAIALRTERDGYILDASGSGKLLITKDGGKNWSGRLLQLPGKSISPETGVPLAVVRFSDANHGTLIVSRQGGEQWALFTTDGGKTWQKERFPGPFGALFLARDSKTVTVTAKKYGYSEKAAIVVLKRK